MPAPAQLSGPAHAVATFPCLCQATSYLQGTLGGGSWCSKGSAVLSSAEEASWATCQDDNAHPRVIARILAAAAKLLHCLQTPVSTCDAG